MFKETLRECMEGHTLAERKAEQVMDAIMKGEATASQIASLLTVLRFRGETVAEMTGFARAMRRHSIQIEHSFSQVVDTCGTGGDDVGTFNISTATALLVSALGVPVAKHGNRAVSSKSGSADVLEALQIPIQSSPEEATASLQKHNMCFMFAPLYHVAMKHAVAPRKEIGFRTIFNLLGPLTNPARAEHQLIGVYDRNFAEKMAETLRRLGTKHSLLVAGHGGLDELSITGPSTVFEVKGDAIDRYELIPEDVGLERGDLAQIQVSTVQESATLIDQVLIGKANKSAQQIVLLNAGAALYAADRVDSIKAGVALAKEGIASGHVADHVRNLRQTDQEAEQHA
ncbi:anthranilate phosphoribosyltransferase [Halalkalibacterium halodurans]|uniref:Anthranilate phosphoribosyltransferase n=1 Tax=Halalkalibacterium halodurans (strain ATCC BAA-125 / DSM 18197 / FERM 7344 / JCM 9153 / C-125) TaxID=272558 RepID=TRPD_HALH5|nr:anthranilate phosphoribosyltransferase [Halalkalibacterium halodurans]Q9KCB3.1 RecName: Full=Anthranilate phosphoribosyltransferase [Halalkalibacterium halodurans C-125]MED4081363.1 anthranilate phosphoribosyltransferase [Halalkalibacterium halodurans]MED4086902.1 anthranilate phosphoribosyltransferase [Halalkalibacterium halodurans]MED4104323.1 anthranilate phosphoribosyltransferase [Halalkalibacterium halodurans]MED4109214.1 anthranilate phosphoribosyltransferase [Halalkalibacterium halod